MPLTNKGPNNEIKVNISSEEPTPMHVEFTYNAIKKPVELKVTKLNISDDALRIDTEQEYERLQTLSHYYKEEDTGYYVESDSDEKSQLHISNDTIVNQALDQILAEYAVFKDNTLNTKSLHKVVKICFKNSIYALLIFGFIKSETNDVEISMDYGWEVSHRTIPDQKSLDECYSYLNKRFNTTLLNINSIQGLKVDTVSFKNDADRIFSDVRYDDVLGIGNHRLYSIHITKPKT